MFDKILNAAKAIIGGVAGAFLPVVNNAVADNPIIWNWEYMLASFLGIGVTVYFIPNKEK